jgi:hypothetical protein
MCVNAYLGGFAGGLSGILPMGGQIIYLRLQT